jgi:hypothetical protein
MSAVSLSLNSALNDAYLHAGFLTILPRIERHARFSFRDVRCTNKKEDLIAETLALSWAWYGRLVRRGKDVTKFVGALARYAARAVRSGRRLTGQEKANDVLSSLAQKRHGFTVASLPASTRTSFEKVYSTGRGQEDMDGWEERLQENMVTPVPDQVSFRLAYPEFVRSLGQRDRRMAHFLSMGNSAKETARRFKISQGRVTQLRQSWCRQWHVVIGIGMGNMIGFKRETPAGWV